MGQREVDRVNASSVKPTGLPGGPAAPTRDYSYMDTTTWDGQPLHSYHRGMAGDPPGPNNMPGVGTAVAGPSGAMAQPGHVPGGDLSMADFNYGGRSQGQWDQIANRYDTRAPIQGDFQLSDASRGMQNDAAARYLAMANGQGPSLAALQLRQGTDQGIAAQMAMANSMRGGSLAHAGAMRTAQLGGQQMQTGLANQAMQQRNLEQMQGMQGYAGMAGQMRGQDLSQAQANLNASLQSRGMNDAMVNAAYGHGMTAAQLDQVGRMGYAGLKGQMATQKYIADLNARVGLQTNQLSNATAQRGQELSMVGPVIGGTLATIGGLAGAAFVGGSNRGNGNPTDPSASNGSTGYTAPGGDKWGDSPGRGDF